MSLADFKNKCLLALEALWAVVNVLVKVSILALYVSLQF